MLPRERAITKRCLGIIRRRRTEGSPPLYSPGFSGRTTVQYDNGLMIQSSMSRRGSPGPSPPVTETPDPLQRGHSNVKARASEVPHAGHSIRTGSSTISRRPVAFPRRTAGRGVRRGRRDSPARCPEDARRAAGSTSPSSPRAGPPPKARMSRAGLVCDPELVHLVLRASQIWSHSPR